nr:ATP-binding cassette domain-containing protein [Solirubrobacterales bacterium]
MARVTSHLKGPAVEPIAAAPVPDSDAGGAELRGPVVPPPIRRIVLDQPPGVATAPVADAGGPAVPGMAGSATRHATTTAGAERMALERLSVFFSGKAAVKDVSLSIRSGEVLALIGPSGCGKTTLLRTLNRLTELTATASRQGAIRLEGQDVDELEVTTLRRRVSMVFQQPNPFPMSIFDNVAYALREQATKRPGRKVVEPHVVDALQRAGLYDEVKDDLDRPALRLSGGQQQRLCIA